MNATLWPNTPVNNIQCEIWRRVGASDWNLNHPACRARSIITCLGEMIDNSLLEFDFRLVDLFCGDAVVLLQVKEAFPGATCIGVDVNPYPDHEIARKVGVELHYEPVQWALYSNAITPIDVVVMLNTFRGWEKAGLPEDEADLPQRVLDWMQANARYVIVTATAEQVAGLKQAGWWIFDVGPGEDDSRMVCMFWSGIK